MSHKIMSGCVWNNKEVVLEIVVMPSSGDDERTFLLRDNLVATYYESSLFDYLNQTSIIFLFLMLLARPLELIGSEI